MGFSATKTYFFLSVLCTQAGLLGLCMMDPSWVADGTLLDKLSDDHLMKFECEGSGGGPTGSSEHVISWGSICSGSEAILFVLLAISAAYKKVGKSVSFVHRYSCEWW